MIQYIRMEDKFLKVAKQAALEAGKVIQKYSSNFGEKIIKEGDKSNFATQADLESEKAIVEIITLNFPKHNIIAEENATSNKGSEYTWVIDPLDGTFSFAHGFPFFSVSVGLLLDNQPILGVINHVSNKDLYSAQKNKGAYLNEKPMHVSKTDVLGESACGLDFGHKKTRAGNLNSYVNPLINRIGYPYCIGSAVSTQAFVAKGILDGYVNQAWVWDFAAGAVMVREAGGKVTDFEGNEPDWTKERFNIVASNGLIHDQILEALKK